MSTQSKRVMQWKEKDRFEWGKGIAISELWCEARRSGSFLSFQEIKDYRIMSENTPGNSKGETDRAGNRLLYSQDI